MLLNDFDYVLPEAQIASMPLASRSASKLLLLDIAPLSSAIIEHHTFTAILEHLSSGDLLVLNDTKVLPARLFSSKVTGGVVEILLERILSPTTALVKLGANKRLLLGTTLLIKNDMVGDVGEVSQDPCIALVIQEKQEDFFILKLVSGASSIDEVFVLHGKMPLPPYIKRAASSLDETRYQTVYGVNLGAVAAPTAGLHFTPELLESIKARGVNLAFVTLHVGAGTYQPLKVEIIEQHTMHAEYMSISAQVCELITATKAAGKRVIAVGTTSVRCLESAALKNKIVNKEGNNTNKLAPFSGMTDIFIYPGFEFKVVDAIITNFHLPKSSLLLLVSAFAGTENIRLAYQVAIENNYRFFSYGDAMFINKAINNGK